MGLIKRHLAVFSVIVFSALAAGCGESPPENNVLVSFEATRLVINEGESTSLRWESIAAETTTISPSIGSVANTGSIEITPTQSTEYTLTARSGEFVKTASLSITVRAFAAVKLTANSTEGDAPLVVRFAPALDSLTAINRVYWDFEGDGDVDSIEAISTSRTYQRAGSIYPTHKSKA